MQVKEIEEIVFKEKQGLHHRSRSRFPQGFAILRIDERYEAGQAAFEEVKNEIQDRLRAAQNGAEDSRVPHPAPHERVPRNQGRLRG